MSRPENLLITLARAQGVEPEVLDLGYRLAHLTDLVAQCAFMKVLWQAGIPTALLAPLRLLVERVEGTLIVTDEADDWVNVAVYPPGVTP